MQTPTPTHYELLQVAEDADPAVIRASYKALAQKYHPDRFQPTAEGESRLRGINAAFATVGDPDKRRAYDQHLAVLRADAQRQAADSIRRAEDAKAKLQQRFAAPVPPPAARSPAPAPHFVPAREAEAPVVQVVIQHRRRTRASTRNWILVLATGAMLLGIALRDRVDWAWLRSVGATATPYGYGTSSAAQGDTPAEASKWQVATADWQRTHREFASDPTRLRTMQAAIDRIDAETGGTLPPADLIARAQRDAYRATGWRGSSKERQQAEGPHIRSQRDE